MSPTPLHAPGWYVDLDGQRAGPFSIEQIQALLQSKKIHPDQLIYNSPSASSTQKVSDFLDDFTDPALSLFDTLQAARVRKPARPLPYLTSSYEPTVHGGLLSRVPSQLWLIGAIAGVLATLIWGASLMLHKSANMLSNTPAPAGGTPPVHIQTIHTAAPTTAAMATPAPISTAPRAKSPFSSFSRIFQRAPSRVQPAAPVARPDPRDDRDRDRDRDQDRDRDDRDRDLDSRDRNLRDDENENSQQQPLDREPRDSKMAPAHEADPNGAAPPYDPNAQRID